MSEAVKRVVVPLDAASEQRAVIDSAARLARRWRARLHGIFVEDEELLGFAGLPFARQVILGGIVERLTAAHIERQLRAFAEAARRELAGAALRHGVEWSFEVVRGGHAPLAVAASRDFLVAGMLTRPIGAHFQVECRWWQTVELVEVSCYLARREWGAPGSVVALLLGRDPASLRMLDAAAEWAADDSGVLSVVCAPELAAAEGFSAWLGERLAPHRLRVQVELAPADPARFVELCIALDCRLLVVDGGSSEARIARLRELAAVIACDFLVVR